MKRPIALLAITTAVLMVGCGSTAPAETSETPVAETTEAPAAEAAPEATTEPVALGTPEVKDGVFRAGEEAAEVYFEWAPIEGADGYEVSVANKYFAEKEYREPETFETTDAFYVGSAQDYFDFQIKVRAYAGEESDRTFGEWS
ncbi:MAG: hypothetical protein J6P81_06810, partial [Spirochaetales bacterium]|nr:hypothetical protein [Spirochaetales bacterium]